MTQFKLTYNPYTVVTKLCFKNHGGWEEIDNTSKFINILNGPLSRWLYPAVDSPGFFAQLNLFGDTQYEIDFYGLKRDFEELNCAAELFCREMADDAPEISLHFLLTDDQEARNRPEGKLSHLRELYERALSIPYIRDSEIPELLHRAFSQEIEAGLVAPLSAGKSTVLNAILGRRLLPTACEAKTAVVTQIVIDPDQRHYSARCRKRNGGWDTLSGSITKERMEYLNDLIDVEDREGKRPAWEAIELRGRVFRAKDDCSPRFDHSYPRKIFTDTPGINNAQNEQHKELTNRLLLEGNQNLLLFLFTAENFQTEDTKHVLETILKALPDPNRLIFVCNRADEITMTYEAQYDKLKALLQDYGISKPNLFLICAKAAELVRTYQYDIVCEKEEELDLFTEDESAMLEGYIKKFACRPGTRIGKFVKASEASGSDPALYHFSSLSKPEQLKLDRQVAALRMEGTKEAELEIALLNSGVPALETYLSNYMDIQVVPVKLRHLSRTMEQKKLMDLGKAVKVDLQKYESALGKVQQEISVIQNEVHELVSADSQLNELLNADLVRGDEVKKQLEEITSQWAEKYVKLFGKVAAKTDKEKEDEMQEALKSMMSDAIEPMKPASVWAAMKKESKLRDKINNAKYSIMDGVVGFGAGATTAAFMSNLGYDGTIILGLENLWTISSFKEMSSHIWAVCLEAIRKNGHIVRRYKTVLERCEEFEIESEKMHRKFSDSIYTLERKKIQMLKEIYGIRQYPDTEFIEKKMPPYAQVNYISTALPPLYRMVWYKSVFRIGKPVDDLCEEMDAAINTLHKNVCHRREEIKNELTAKEAKLYTLNISLEELETKIGRLKNELRQTDRFFDEMVRLLEIEPSIDEYRREPNEPYT